VKTKYGDGTRGNLIIIGDKIYACCALCGELVRVNKPIIGSLHLCSLDEEAAK